MKPLWHRDFPDEREAEDAEDAGDWREGFWVRRELAGVRSSGKGPMPHLDFRIRGGILIEQGSMPQESPPLVASGLPRWAGG